MSTETYLEKHDPDSPLVTRTAYMKRVLTEAMHLATLREYREMPPHLLMAMAMVDLAHTDRIDQGIANVGASIDDHLLLVPGCECSACVKKRDAKQERTMTKAEMVAQDVRAFRALNKDDEGVLVVNIHQGAIEEGLNDEELALRRYLNTRPADEGVKDITKSVADYNDDTDG